MLVACWSAKGGSGTTVVACALARVLAEASDVVVADLAGDVPAVLGVPDSGPGVADWAAAGPEVASDGLSRLAVEAAPRLRVLRRGRPEATDSSYDRVPSALAGCGEVVVADCGVIGPDPEHAAPGAVRVAAAAGLSLLVIQPCYLALRRALAAPLRPSAAIVVKGAGRALGVGDISSVLDVPVRAIVPVDAGIARAVDAGLLASRVPARLRVPLRRALR